MEIQEAFKYIEKRTRELVNYSDKLRTAFKEIDAAFYPLFKDAGIFYTDTEPIDSDELGNNYLKVGKDNQQGYWGFIYGNEYFDKQMMNQSRYLIKQAIFRLPAFLAGYIERLDKKTEEYKKASEMAEAMCNALKELKEKEGE